MYDACICPLWQYSSKVNSLNYASVLLPFHFAIFQLHLCNTECTNFLSVCLRYNFMKNSTWNILKMQRKWCHSEWIVLFLLYRQLHALTHSLNVVTYCVHHHEHVLHSSLKSCTHLHAIHVCIIFTSLKVNFSWFNAS